MTRNQFVKIQPTKKELAVLVFIASCRIIPSIKDICRGIGIKSNSTANYYLERLTRMDLIHRDKLPSGRYIPRSVVITNKGWDVIGDRVVCPVCGTLTLETKINFSAKVPKNLAALRSKTIQ